MTCRRVVLVATCCVVAMSTIAAQDIEAGNRIDVRLSCRVQAGENGFAYSYALSNGDTATQAICQFDIRPSGFTSIANLHSPVNWDQVLLTDGVLVIRWLAKPLEDTEGYVDPIVPRSSRSGFGFWASALPSIVIYYAEGHHPLPKFEEGMATDSIPGYSDLTPYGPGVVGRTVGPVLPPDPFNPIGFLDTLLSYTAQSYPLGWISGQTTTDKYVGFFTSAKTSLQNGNLSAARTTLRQVLQEVNVDSSSALTSEAYALLRYSTEFLLSKLPAPPAINALNPSMTIAGSGAFTLVVSGTNFEEGSRVNWNGSERTTNFVADSVLRASILASDVAVVGSPAVTVKNADGSESDAARFYVISTVAWVDTLISCKHRAYDAGWIDDRGIANSLDQKLENARKQLEQGNNKAAKNILEAFVNEVEAQKGKHISNEAYALLKFNAEFLISKL